MANNKKQKKERTMNQLIADLRKTKPEVGSLEWHQKRSFFSLILAST